MKRVFLFLLAGLLLLSSCSAPAVVTETETNSIPVSNETTQAQKTQTEEEALRPVITQALLTPAETFSRERVGKAEYVMLHFTSAIVTCPEDPYSRTEIRKIFEDYGVSVHYIILRDGTIECWVPESLAAYHAGKGQYGNNEAYTNRMNDYAIGIEMAAMGSREDMSLYLTSQQYDALDPEWIGYTEEQYASLILLVQDICRRNEIPFDRQHVIGHEEYSPSKNDPGELFDWSRLFPQ